MTSEELMASWSHVHSRILVTKSITRDLNGAKYTQYVAACGTCEEESDSCDTAAIAKRNLRLTNNGGTRPW